MNPWCTPEQIAARLAGVPEDKAAIAALMASEQLFAATGERFGVVTRTVRPQGGCGGSFDYGPPSARAVVGFALALPLARVVGPWPLPGPYGGMSPGWLAECSGCGDYSTSGIELPGSPVWDTDHPITATVDGVDLPSDGTAWVLVSGSHLVRVDGKVFPQCQDIRKPATEPGTCQVIYSAGVPVPMLGQQAAVSLAIEYAKLNKWVAGECKLPQRLTSITRQGVTATVLDPGTVIAEGRTGLTDVDMFVVGMNPNRLQRSASIATPGIDDCLPTVQTGARA